MAKNENGMTVRDFGLDFLAKHHKGRYDRLVQMGAPDMIIKAEERLIEKYSMTKDGIRGDEAVLDTVFETFEYKTGRGGKMFVKIDKNIYFFPFATYSPFMSVYEKGEEWRA